MPIGGAVKLEFSGYEFEAKGVDLNWRRLDQDGFPSVNNFKTRTPITAILVYRDDLCFVTEGGSVLRLVDFELFESNPDALRIEKGELIFDSA